MQDSKTRSGRTVRAPGMNAQKKEALDEIKNVQETSGLRRLDQFKVSHC
jgi:hypothetical protein